jgi:hypothetical protein
LVLELLNSFGIVLNVLIVGQRDSKEPIREIAEGAVALRFIVLFKSLVGGIVVTYSINHFLSVVVGSSSYSVYSKLVFLLPIC